MSVVLDIGRHNVFFVAPSPMTRPLRLGMTCTRFLSPLRALERKTQNASDFRHHIVPACVKPVVTAALINNTATVVTAQPSVTAGDSSNTGKAPVLSPRVARSAVLTLVSYFSDLSTREPFIARRLLLAVMCIITSKLIGISVPFFFKRAIDALMLVAMPPSASSAASAASGRMARIAIITILLHGLARITASITHELRNAVFAKGGQRVGRRITATSFAHLHSLDVSFHIGSRTGAVTRVVDRGTRSIMTIFRAVIFSFFPSFFELILVCTVLFTRFSAIYVAVTLATFAAFTGWTFAVNNKLSRERANLNSAEDEASAKLTDSLINVDAVKLYDNELHEISRYDASLQLYETIAVRNEKLYARLNIGQTLSFTTGLTALLLLATRDIISGRISVGSVVLLSTMLQRLWVPLDFLGWQYREVKQSLIDMQNLFDILNRKSAVVDAPNAKMLTVSRGEIVFDDVTFVYPVGDEANSSTVENASPPADSEVDNDIDGIGPYEDNGSKSKRNMRGRRRIAIDHLSFTVPAGSSVALVGASGSGKSTATRLLCRLYDVTAGRILIDGQDIAKATLWSLRQAVSIVPQDTALFNDTIAYNIRYGRPSATDEEVVAAAKAASIHNVIMKTEHGYDTIVGERGIRLSGGERQRLSVARAFLKGSRIIVEDESTSALDTLTELEVSKALQNLGVNRTRIIVAHRLSTIMHVDRVVVMKDGRKVEEGGFDELLHKNDGLFRDMWKRQQRKQEAFEENDMEDEHKDDRAGDESKYEERRNEDIMYGSIWESPRDG